MNPKIIKINTNIINFYSFLFILFFELSLLLPFFLTINDSATSSFGIIVYICSPLIFILGIFLNKIIIKQSTRYLKCYPDKIVIVQKLKITEIKVEPDLLINFSRWWDFATFEFGPGQVTFCFENNTKSISVYLSKKDYNILKELYYKE